MGFCSLFLILTTILTLNSQSSAQLTFNPNSKTGEDWTLAGHKRSNDGDHESLQVNFYQPWHQRHQRSEADRSPLLDTLLKLVKLPEGESAFLNDQNYLAISSPLELGRHKKSGIVSKSNTNFPGTFREY